MSDAYREMLQANRAAVESFQRTMAGRSGSGIPDAVQATGEVAGAVVGLAEARAAHAAAVARVARVREAMARAQDRADANERDLARYNAIDDRIERWVAEQAYADEPSDQLPLSEQLAMAERGRAVERHDLAARALRHVAGELHAAELEERQTDRQLRASASAELMQQAEWLAQELEGVQAHEVELRQRLRAFADCNLPTMTGAAPLPPKAVELLNAPRVEIGRDLALEMKLREQHAALIADD